MGVLAALDATGGPERILTATVVLGPFLASLFCTTRQTVVVGVAAVAASLLGGYLNDASGTFAQVVREIVVVAGSVLSVLSARARARVAATRHRLEVLARIAELSDHRLDLPATAERLVDLLVPDVADTCVVDVLRDGVPQRLAVRIADPAAAELEPRVAARTIPPAGVEGMTATSSMEPRLLVIDDETYRRAAQDEDDLALMRRVGSTSALVSQLRAGGRTVGALSLTHTARSGRRFTRADVAWVQSIADRTALALENSGLSSELAAAERRLGVALDGMAAAVIIQRPGRGIVYANRAAADAMGLPTAEAVMAATPEEIAGGWESYNEDGTPLRPDQYPSRRILTGAELEPAPLVSRGVHHASGREQWLLVKATAILDDDGVVEMAVSVSEDITAIKRAERIQRFLARTGEALASSLDYEETLQEVARLAVPELADWCSVTLPGEDGTLRQAAVAHRDPEMMAFAHTYNERFPSRTDAEGGVAEVMRSGGGQLIAEIDDAMLVAAVPDPEQLAMLRRIGMRSVVLAPIEAPGGPPLGVLTLVDAESGRSFGPGDLEVAEELGRRAGVAMQNARLYTERTRIAATLQRSLLPDALPDVPGFALASVYRPAGHGNWVGGDFYDAFETPAGWMIVIGDVAGQGAAAAALTAQARHTLRTAGMLTGDPAATVAHLNDLLVARAELALCTVCAVLLGEDVARVVCGGHPLPVLVRDARAADRGRTGSMVGAWPSTFTAADVALAPGDVLVLYTDGVLDARRGVERFGDERLRGALAPASGAEDAVARVVEALDAFQDGPQADDTALLVLERLPVGARLEADAARATA